MQNFNLKRADEIHVGDKIQLAAPLEVIARGSGQSFSTLWLKINEEKELKLEFPSDSFLAVHTEPTEIPDDGEILDRLLAVIVQYTPITKSIMDAMEALTVNKLLDIPSLIELSNEFDTFGIEPVRSCRVCGCTDDDCSQCIEATGEPCSWVEEDLCSRCFDEKLNATIKELEQ